MPQTFTNPRRRAASARRLLAAPIIGLLAAAFMLLAPGLASAATTLNVVGTSDVSDSGLIPNLIRPAFQAAYPQYTLNYVGKASGVAINYAKTANGNPSVLIVHAPSLENQFVSGGYSYNNAYGTALFTNDFVLAGSSQDPVGVGTNDPHNIVKAFADVAIAGAAGNAVFLSRGGGTTASGTTVQEHQIWQLVDESGLTQGHGVAFCKVGDGTGGTSNDGGGETPIATGSPNAGGTCPASDGYEVNGTQANDLPAWFDNNGDGSVTQAGNVTAANACTVGSNDCYVFTDRGTFDYLTDGASATGGANTIGNLSILTRNNSADAPGGANELTNYFHAYVINPTVSGGTGNIPAAQAFVSFLTSPTIQAELKTYLPTSPVDSGGAPFVADASPALTASPNASTVAGGKQVTITGTATNSEPNFAQISGQPVTVSELVGTLPVTVATGNTDANGNYSIAFTPSSSGSYQVSTGAISQVEIPTLSPAYGDILSPAASRAFPLTVQSGVAIASAVPSTGGATIAGTVSPAPIDGNGVVNVLARPTSSTGSFTQIGTEKLLAGQGTFAVSGTLSPGTYTVEAAYGDGLAVAGATSAATTVTVPVTTSTTTKPFSPSYKKLTVKNGALTLTGTLNKVTAASGATVKLFGLKTVKVKVNKAKKTKKTSRVEHAAAVAFKQVGKATVKKGNKTFTVKVKLTRGYRWILQLQFSQKGQTTTYSKVRYLDVH